MKKYIYFAVAIIALFLFIGWQADQLKKAKADRNIYRSNTDVLMQDVQRYQTEDSLNAISIGNLELKLSEYKKYRDDDLKLIESLKVDKNRLRQITTAQTKTIYNLQGNVRDSIIYLDKEKLIVDTLRCITINDTWFDLNGCASADYKFNGTFVNRDSLLYVEHIVPKKFWFIKWGVKERKQDIVSRNPYTIIIGAEFITMRK